MGKKKGGKSSGFVSQGIHRNVKQSTLREMRRGYMSSGERMMNQREAFNLGKNVMLTIANPNPNETNRLFIRVPARQIWERRK